MILPKGITGFGENGDQPSLLSDMKPFLTACYDAARRLGGNVVASEIAYSRQTNNFAVVTVTIPGRTFAALLNAHYPIVGFAEPIPAHQQDIRFMDAPAFAEALVASGNFEVLSKDDLESPVTPDTVDGLAEAELTQVRYWKPQRLGEIIFTFSWD
jgi:hypothetical protein